MMASSFIKNFNEEEIKRIRNKKSARGAENLLHEMISEKKIEGLTQVFIKDISKFITKGYDISLLDTANHDKIYILNAISVPNYSSRLRELIKEKLNLNFFNFSNKICMLNFVSSLQEFADKLNYDNENLLDNLAVLFCRSRTNYSLTPESLISNFELIIPNMDLIMEIFEQSYIQTIVGINIHENFNIASILEDFGQMIEIKIPNTDDDSFLLQNNLVKCGEEIYDMKLFEKYLPKEEMVSFKYPLNGKMEIFQMPKKEYEKILNEKNYEGENDSCCQICMSRKSEVTCGNKCGGEICLDCYYNCGVKSDKCSFCRKITIPICFRE